MCTTNNQYGYGKVFQGYFNRSRSLWFPLGHFHYNIAPKYIATGFKLPCSVNFLSAEYSIQSHLVHNCPVTLWYDRNFIPTGQTEEHGCLICLCGGHNTIPDLYTLSNITSYQQIYENHEVPVFELAFEWQGTFTPLDDYSRELCNRIMVWIFIVMIG